MECAHTAARSLKGIQSVRLSNGLLEAEVLPGLGAKVWTLRSQRTGKQWIWHNPTSRLKAPPDGAPYDDHWAGGWEELFPNDAPGPFDGRDLPDHGEWWSRAWSWEPKAGGGSVGLVLRLMGILPEPRLDVSRMVPNRKGHAWQWKRGIVLETSDPKAPGRLVEVLTKDVDGNWTYQGVPVFVRMNPSISPSPEGSTGSSSDVGELTLRPRLARRKPTIGSKLRDAMRNPGDRRLEAELQFELEPDTDKAHAQRWLKDLTGYIARTTREAPEDIRIDPERGRVRLKARAAFLNEAVYAPRLLSAFLIDEIPQNPRD